jgi:hypothetical protein
MHAKPQDFHPSYAQKRWESAAASHSRACKALKLLDSTKSASIEFWQSLKLQLEAKYPQLQKPMK